MKRNNRNWIYYLVIMGAIALFTAGCEKNSDGDEDTGSTVTDIDGNVYKTVTIGSQEWMAENLRTTKYSNGDPVSNVLNVNEWSALSSGAYANYANDANNSKTYGRLYNWYAVTDDRNICPTGWHVPSNAEWTTLVTSLGGQPTAGGKLKETGTTHWSSPNTGADNESGFKALPGGMRSAGGAYSNKGDYVFFWSTTQSSTYYSWYRYLYYLGAEITSSAEDHRSGLSVRCVKDYETE